MAKRKSPIWAYLTVLLAAAVGLAMTPAFAQGAGGAESAPGASSSSPGQQQGQQPGEQQPGMTPGQNPSSQPPSAETPNSQGAAGQAAESGQTAQGTISATGCLQKASSGNGYQLTDTSSMKTYDLTPASSDVDLSAQVGHTVTVTGTPAQASASTGAAGAAAQGGEAGAAPAGQAGAAGAAPSTSGQQANQQLSVSSVSMVSSSCQSGQ